MSKARDGETENESENKELLPPTSTTQAQIQVAEDLTRGPIERTAEGAITHKGMRQVLSRGGSVVYKGQHFGKLSELPDQIRVEGTSVEALDSIEEDLDKQQAELDAKRKRIKKRRNRLENKAAEAEETDEVEVAEDAEETEEAETETPAYDEMSKKQLLKEANKRKLDPTDSMTKTELVNLLEENDGTTEDE